MSPLMYLNKISDGVSDLLFGELQFVAGELFWLKIRHVGMLSIFDGASIRYNFYCSITQIKGIKSQINS